MARSAGRWVVAVVGTLIAVWLAAGLIIWNRNVLPDPPSLTRNLPADNVYDTYVQLVTQVKHGDALQTLHGEKRSSGAEVDTVLRDNAAVLEKLRALAGKPCVVTELKPGVRFVGALAFPGVTRLVAVSVRKDAAARPDQALETLSAGYHFALGVMQGGATLHVTTSFLSSVPLFEVTPELLPRLNTAQLERLAKTVDGLTTPMTQLRKIMEAERVVRLEQLLSIARPGATRIFRFDIPRERYEWDFIRKPKRPAYDALDAYLQKWVSFAEVDLSEIDPPPYPSELQGILADESLAPENMVTHFVRYRYILARMRLIYAAARLEAYKKKQGSYPARLETVLSAREIGDPFSRGPLLYRRTGTGYVLYSAGPNGKDDGGQPYVESRMRPDVTGDLLLRPNF